jgi:hypothetical protein
VLFGVLNGGLTSWIPVSVAVERDANRTRFGMSLDLGRNEPFWLIVYNDHPEGAGVSRFVIHGMTGSVDPARLAATSASGLHKKALIGRALAAAAKKVRRVRQVFAEALSARRLGQRLLALADSSVRITIASLPERLRRRIVRAAPEYRAIERAFNVSAEQARALAPLQDLSFLQTRLRRHRPKDLHVNGCGDFQLMAREHWHDLHGYAEFEAFSDNVDSLLSFTADAAGIEEQVLPTPIFHLDYGARSGPPPDEDDIGRRRMAERGVPRLDAATVAIWASHMRWLQRPITFNSPDWGLHDLELPERPTVAASLGSTL